MLSRLKAWVMDRAGITPEHITAIDKPLPKGVGWLNTLGACALLSGWIQSYDGVGGDPRWPNPWSETVPKP